VPSHAVELTSAYLDRAVAGALTRHGIRAATPAQKENLAALIHLCGAGVGDRYAKRGLHFAPGLRCGDHDAARYIARVARKLAGEPVPRVRAARRRPRVRARARCSSPKPTRATARSCASRP